ncbi:MAG: hypothetical protein M1825_003599 [Sarcosagium campestre]|nr:MAG: hypothetical protein M1825_003599 [Sarcosagium campestre]
MPEFLHPPPNPTHALLSFPAPHVLLVTLNRPEALNSITTRGHHELDAVWRWLDGEPGLRVGVVTGRGRAFCAGADLKEWHASAQASPSKLPSVTSEEVQPRSDPAPTPATATTGRSGPRNQPPSGFGGLSRRSGRKPVIAAVNGLCLGGGFEMVVNCDMVVASAAHASFALPEVARGVVAIAGALPRLARIIGRQRAMEMALTGRRVDALEMKEWGLVNSVVGGEVKQDDQQVVVVKEAIRLAELVARNSPDAVLVSREGVKMAWEAGGVEEGSERLVREWYTWLERGENIKEGLKAFVEKREPRWVDSKL